MGYLERMEVMYAISWGWGLGGIDTEEKLHQ